MNPVTTLLARPSAFSGLGLIAVCSALSGPLSLEILFNHADLWFQGLWQDQAFSIVWLSWTTVGVLSAVSWGLDRGFMGITPSIHATYSQVLSLIGVFIYLLFSIPTWVWLYRMSLVEVIYLFKTVSLSFIILSVSALSASSIEQRLSTLPGVITGLFVGGGLTHLVWICLLKPAL